MGLLAPPLRTLATAVRPAQMVIDLGGAGQCGPNSLAYLLGLLGFDDLDGPRLRVRVCDYASQSDNLRLESSLTKPDGAVLSQGELIQECVANWPTRALQGKPPTVATWIELTRLPPTWTDVAFTQLVASVFGAAIRVKAVDDLSQIADFEPILPTPGVHAEYCLDAGCWLGRHIVAIVDVATPEAGPAGAAAGSTPVAQPGALPRAASRQGPLPPPKTVSWAANGGPPQSPAAPAGDSAPTGSEHQRAAENLSDKRRELQFPLTELAQLHLLLSAPDAPDILVGFEFSGALRSRLEEMGHSALSVDLRECEVGGKHYVGDVRDVLGLKHWSRVYLFPPCFQQLRADVDCLPLKISDGRAFWGCLLVLWCLCAPAADFVMVEQADTIVYDYLNTDLLPDLEVLPFRSSQFGDAHDKFFRMGLRNARLPAYTHRQARRVTRPRSQFQFTTEEERDRQRSTWRLVPNTATAAAEATQRSPGAVAVVDYLAVAADFALRWRQAGHPVPDGYLHPRAQPPRVESRRYQLERGPGDGRKAAPSEHPRVRAGESAVRSLLRAGAYDTAFNSDAGGGGPSSPPGASSDEEDAALACDGEAVQARLAQAAEAEGVPVLDARTVAEGAALLMFVCVIGQPLVFAHANGFTITGLTLPPSSRPVAMAKVQALCTNLVSAFHIAFMVGQYLSGARLFASPVDFRPHEAQVVRTTAHRRDRLAAGATFLWCTLSALTGTPIYDAAARAMTSTQMFVQPVTRLPDADMGSGEDVVFSFGRSPARSVVAAPQTRAEGASFARCALADMVRADRALADSILEDVEAGDALLGGWAERIKPMDIEAIPPALLAALPTFADEHLDRVRLSEPVTPYRLAWVPKPPRQPPPHPDAPACVGRAGELLTPAARSKVERWLSATVADLASIRDQLERRVSPREIQRSRPEPLAVGQAELQPWAQGYVWDCTRRSSSCCVVQDFAEDITTHLHRDYLRARLEHYPDQALVSYLLEGARLEADVELQIVAVPHLASLPLGYASVGKELRRLQSLSWYSFFDDMPFVPMYLNGQGATARKLEPDRFRRTTEGGGPRTATFDAAGLQAISINDASRIHHMPKHFLTDQRPAFQEWLRQRGLPAPKPQAEPDGRRRHSKWVRERKPDLSLVARDLTVLKRAAHVMQQPVYGFGDDAKDYFNQLAMCPSEWHKLGIVFLAEGQEISGIGDRPLFVSEKVLGFGTHGASNIAQRFGDAQLDLFREDMDEAETELRERASAAEIAWLETRLALQRGSGLPCTPIRKWSTPSTSARPDIPAPPSVAAIPAGYVCPELRLYAVYQFTDDPQYLAVGIERTKQAIRVARRLSQGIGLIMAIEEKRSLGSWVKWLGIILVPALGLILVPRDKILRAGSAISLALANELQFHEYRSLCGLLEHIRAVAALTKQVMHGLYRPHGPLGESRQGPAATVFCDLLMTKQLKRWLHLVVRACGTSVKRNHETAPGEAEVTFDLTSDACYADVHTAGLGGFFHGFYWLLLVHDADKPALSIPILEFLGAALTIVVFHAQLKASIQAGVNVCVVLRTDALTAALTLPAESMRSPLLVAAYSALTETEAWRDLSPFIKVAHLYGDGNPGADYISRQKWRHFRRFCAQLGVRPVKIDLPDEALAIYLSVVLIAHQLRAQTNVAPDADTLQRDDGATLDAASDDGKGQPDHRAHRGGTAHRALRPSARTAKALMLVMTAGLGMGERRLLPRDPPFLYGNEVIRFAMPVRDADDRRPAGPWFYSTDRIHLLGWEWHGHGLDLTRRIQLVRAQVQDDRYVSQGAHFFRAPRDYSERFVDTTPEMLQELVEDNRVHVWASKRRTPPSSPPRIGTPPPEADDDEPRQRQPMMDLLLRDHVDGEGATPHTQQLRDYGEGTEEPPAQQSLPASPPSAAHPPCECKWARTGGTVGACLNMGVTQYRVDDDDLVWLCEHCDANFIHTGQCFCLCEGCDSVPLPDLPPAQQSPPASPHVPQHKFLYGNEVPHVPDHKYLYGNEVLRFASAGSASTNSAPPRDAVLDKLRGVASPTQGASAPSPSSDWALNRVRGMAALNGASPGAESGNRRPAKRGAPDDSPLRMASQSHARQRALALTGDPADPCAFRGDPLGILHQVSLVNEAVLEGVNPSTLSIDERAWTLWEGICKEHGTSPLRTAKDARDFPERSAHLLAALLIRCFLIGKPKNNARAFIKPKSALAYPLAIIRIFGRWGVTMPNYKQLAAAVSGLSRRYLAKHGPMSLAPVRSEPMKFATARRIFYHLDDSSHDSFMVRRLNVFMMFTAFRLGEIVGGPGYLLFSSIKWMINGVLVDRPTREQLNSLQPGRDKAIITVPLSKPDQTGEIHCPFPIYATYSGDPFSVASVLRDLELRIGITLGDRGACPLFGNETGRVYTHNHLHSRLREVLTQLYGKQAASMYSWHSYRSGLATALHAAKVDDHMIQLICRWMCPESLHVYRRMGMAEHERLIGAASQCDVNAVQAPHFARVIGDQGFAQLIQEMTVASPAANNRARDFDAAAAAGATEEDGRPSAQRRQPPAAPNRLPVTLQPLTAPPQPGDELVVPYNVWPKYVCKELGGAGWAARVVRVTPTTAKVSFLHARTRNGRRYEDAYVPLARLLR